MASQLNISLPQGVKDSLPDETKKIDRIERGLLSVLKKSGFKRVGTPQLEYLDVLSIGLGGDLKDKVFKFIDPVSGRVVVIRPDVTPQIARLVATRMRDYALPLKVCYDEKVFRYQEPKSGRIKEIQQIGAELITRRPSPQINADIIITAIRCLKALGLKNFKIDIGEVGFVKGMLDGLELLSEREKNNIKNAIALKDSSALKAILDSLNRKIGERERGAILNIPSLFGGKEVLEKAKAVSFNKQAGSAVEDLSKTLDILDKKGGSRFITLDLAEVRGFDYYTGIIFEGFAKGFGKAIMSGGRYDTLLQKYGYACAAVGFAFDVENIVSAMKPAY